jgi:cell surface protein SprA
LLFALLMVVAVRVSAQADSTSSSWHQMGGDYIPSSITTTVEYDPETGDYVQVRRAGNVVLGRKYMTFNEYQDWQMDQLMRTYWHDVNKTTAEPESSGGFLSKIPGFKEISRKLESLLGKPEIKITPSGSAELTFQVVNNYRKDPQLDANKRSVTTFDFDENIQISLNAKIGDLINFDINWNTQATFDFENKIKLKYEGKEDDIIQLFEAADISFPLNTTLIKGSQQLFGFHTKLKFGKLTIDAVVS